MSVLELKLNPTRQELRVFAGLLALFSLGFAGLFFWRDSWNLWKQALVGFGVVIGLVGLAAPPAIRRVYQLWMLAVFPIGWVVSHLILSIVYYLVLTPIGLTLRLLGRDPLHRKPDPSAETYWVKRPPERPLEDYFRQS